MRGCGHTWFTPIDVQHAAAQHLERRKGEEEDVREWLNTDAQTQRDNVSFRLGDLRFTKSLKLLEAD